MGIRSIATVTALLLVVTACSSGDQNDAGTVVDVPPDDPRGSLYAPEDRDALAFTLPSQVSGVTLLRAPSAMTQAEELRHLDDRRIRTMFVDKGWTPSRLQVEQKSSHLGMDAFPQVALAAVQITDVAADEFVDWEPTAYMLLTTIVEEQYEWMGEKPGGEAVEIVGMPVWLADFGGFRVAWYAKGEVLYVVVAQNDQLLRSALLRMPRPDGTLEV